MIGRISITERIYESVKTRILSGSFASGARIEANDIANAERVSPTPVRNALNRLVGAGYLVSHSNEGFYAPLLTEQDLRDLYDCCAALLGLAISRAPRRQKRAHASIEIEAADIDVPLRTERVFLNIMALSGNRSLYRLFEHASSRLRPVRAVEASWIGDREKELARIRVALEARNLEDLAQHINAYHRRRLRYVARVIARLASQDTGSA